MGGFDKDVTTLVPAKEMLETKIFPETFFV